MNLFSEAISASKESKKNDGNSFWKIRRQFWQICRRIDTENIKLTADEKAKLDFHKMKMK